MSREWQPGDVRAFENCVALVYGSKVSDREPTMVSRHLAATDVAGVYLIGQHPPVLSVWDTTVQDRLLTAR